MKKLIITPSIAVLQGIASYYSKTPGDFLEWKDLNKEELLNWIEEKDLDDKTVLIKYGLIGLLNFYKAKAEINVNDKEVLVFNNGINILRMDTIEYANINNLCFKLMCLSGTIIKAIEENGQQRILLATTQTSFKFAI